MRWIATTSLVSVDTETTDKDPEHARVIDIAAAYITPGRSLDLRQAYVNPGVPIPAESTAVHGLTDEFIQTNGKPAAEVLDLFLGEIAAAMSVGAVLVIQNARYDVTVLEREAGRLGIASLSERLGGRVAPVADPIVLDKRLIKFRSRVSDEQGPRVLKTLAQIYGVDWNDEQAHGAAYDAVITARVLWKMGAWCALPRPDLMQKQTCFSAAWKKVRAEDAAWFERIAAMSPAQLHDAQVEWAAEQATGLAAHWREKAGEIEASSASMADAEREAALAEAAKLRTDADGVTTEWPVRALAVSA